MCNNCGAMLVAARKKGGTRNLAEELPEFRENPVFTASGSNTFKEGMSIKLTVEGKEEALTVKPGKPMMLIGRRDALSQHVPDVDMEDFEGYRLGVSRKHAQLLHKQDELSIQDYGSANGTFLNGVKLPAHRPHKLSDGDEVRLGHLTMRVYFV
jgi:hypothetical protein